MLSQPKSTKRLSRRDMLKLSGVVAAGTVLAACSQAATTEAPAPTEPPVEEAPEPTKPPAEEPTKAPEPTEAPPPPSVEGNVVVAHQRNELSEDQEAQFEADNPGITIEFVASNQQNFYAMAAAGIPPDLYRTQAPIIPSFLARGLLYDLTPYFETSDLIKIDDLADPNKYYWAENALTIGSGKIYGMCKDWSPDFTIFINTDIFAAAGVSLPDETTPMTYQEVKELAATLAKFEGDRIATWGYGYESGWTDRIWMNNLAELGESLYTPDFSRVVLTGNPNAVESANYYFTLAKENLSVSPVNPSPNDWAGGDFTAGILGIMQYGYWFSAMAETDATRGKVMMLPAPTWSGDHRDPTMTATGMVMISQTQVPDAAWKVFEWYNAGQPSIDRAGSGWGVPALKSQFELMPKESPYQQQVQKVLANEIAVSSKYLQFNPFLGEGSFVNAWNTNLDQALRDEITFDECLANVESEVNTLIQEGIDRLS